MNQTVDEIVKDINEAQRLLYSIMAVQNKADGIFRSVDSKIHKAVYACYSVEELAELYKSFGMENQVNLWSWAGAYVNSFEEDTDYEKQEWGDVQFHATRDIRNHLDKIAKERWKIE